ncbi:hypothetical protein LUZ61_012553 [Rhynchospora tenuis]|uniref:Uncharacterized protein n=1 Tax=Rhynchospora tenuis TaxID=198213 RepID=A0AAD6A3J8_9POAL|nr:hypothetical protein LUZ61_012553 [Rhynchospora tenuis]
MALLCFLLDLRNIPPPLLRSLKLCLLQLANYYAISQEKRTDTCSSSTSLPDRLALAYIHPMKHSPSSSELKIAYTPREKFSLRDFHHAVNNLPQDSFSHELGDLNNTTAGQDVLWGNLFSNKALYTWSSDEVSKKVIAICMSPYNDIKALRRSLMDAADQCISVEFVILESAYILSDDRNKEFFDKLCDLENCVIRQYIPDTPVLHGLFKRWLEELKGDVEEPLQAVFYFKNAIFGSESQISCNLVATTNSIMDGFMPCKACRCHGVLTSTITSSGKQKKWCQVSGHELEFSDIIENSIRIGKDNILILPSFDVDTSVQRVSLPISFNVMQRTNLASLDEGVIMGASYRVYPSSSEDDMGLDVSNVPDQNIQIFKGLCRALFNLDQALVCSSTCNMETMRDASFLCYYLLLPSQYGQMLLRRLAGSEEILPMPNTDAICESAVPKEMESYIQASLSKIAVKDYNPLDHERGFHTKLNGLVKESLQLRSMAPICPKTSLKLDIPKSIPSPMPKIVTRKENRTPVCVTEEWDQLVILDDSESTKSPIVNLRLKSDAMSSNFLSESKPVDEKTTKILERLEPPKPKRQQKKDTSAVPVIVNGVAGQMKRPLLPFDSNAYLNLTQSQPLRPDFQKRKKKPKA